MARPLTSASAQLQQLHAPAVAMPAAGIRSSLQARTAPAQMTVIAAARSTAAAVTRRQRCEGGARLGFASSSLVSSQWRRRVQQQQQRQWASRWAASTAVQVEANWKQEILWTDAKVVKSEKEAELLYSITLDIKDNPELKEGYTKAGQFVQVKVGDSKPAFLAIASPPEAAGKDGVFEFLVKAVEGSTAELLTKAKVGEDVQVSQVLGKGFNLDALAPPADFPSVLLFATGSGISPIRAVIEAGFDASKRSDVRLYFGVRNVDYLPYQDRFDLWRASGVEIIPVLSQPEGNWSGETGFVQNALKKAAPLADGSKAGAVLCGYKGMAEEVTAILKEQGVASNRILLNF